MRVVVTGGSGFVGTNLVEHFLSLDHDVRSLDAAAPRNPEHQSVWRKVDLLDRTEVIQAFERFEPTALLHFGARTDLREKVNLAGYAANMDGVCHVLEALQQTESVERAIFASSQLVCDVGYAPRDDYDFKPGTLYGQSKVLTERIVRAGAKAVPCWTIVRPTSLWGPWFGEPYRDFFQAIKRGIYLHVGGANPLKQWGYIGNAVYQVQKLLEAPADAVHQKVFYLADYKPTRLRDFADKVQRALGAKRIKTAPKPILRAVAKAGDCLNKLGWRQPPLTSFRLRNMTSDELHDLGPLEEIVGPLPFDEDEAIEETVRWLAEQPVG